jgi:hypothetical protein
MSWKKKEFEDIDDLLVSFRLYFVIAEDNLYHVLFTLINIYGIDCQKNENLSIRCTGGIFRLGEQYLKFWNRKSICRRLRSPSWP